MKKTALLVVAALLLLAAGCSVAVVSLEPSPYGSEQKSDDIEMTVNEQTVSTDVDTLTLTIRNQSDTEYTYGVMSQIETEIDGVWYVVPPKEEIMWIAIACILEPGGTNEESVTIKDFYGNLEKGHYRVVKTFSSESGSLDAFATFSVE